MLFRIQIHASKSLRHILPNFFIGPMDSYTLLPSFTVSASGLVVKFIVAIDEPPVQFRAGAWYFSFSSTLNQSYMVYFKRVYQALYFVIYKTVLYFYFKRDVYQCFGLDAEKRLLLLVTIKTYCWTFSGLCITWRHKTYWTRILVRELINFGHL